MKKFHRYSHTPRPQFLCHDRSALTTGEGGRFGSANKENYREGLSRLYTRSIAEDSA